MSENGKIRFPLSGNPSLPPPVGSYYVWLDSSGYFKKMDSAGNITNLSVQSLSDLTDVNLTGLQDGQVIVWNEASQTWIPADMTGGGGGGVTTYLGLTDTPGSYAGSAGMAAVVNTSENGLTFQEMGAGGGTAMGTAIYEFQVSTNPNVSSGQVRFNHNDLQLADRMYISGTDQNGDDLSAFYENIIDEGFSIYIQARNDPAKGYLFQIDGSPTESNDVYTYDVTFIKRTGTAIANEDTVSTTFVLRSPPVNVPVDSVNGQIGNVVLDADDIDDSTTAHKFATQAQLNQIATNTSNISTNAGDISGLENEIGNAETQINTNSANITALQGQMTDAQQDIIDIENQIAGGIGKTYNGVEAIQVNNSDDLVSLKLSEDPSGLYDSLTVSGFTSAPFNAGYSVVKRDGERVKIDLDLEGSNIKLKFDVGNYQLYRNSLYGDRFIGYCDEIGYWIAVQLANAHPLQTAQSGELTLAIDSWVQLGTGSTAIDNGALVPDSTFLSYSGFAVNDSYLTQSNDGLQAEVVTNLAIAQQFKLADSLAIKQYVDANSGGGGGSGMAVAEKTIISLDSTPLIPNTLYLVYPDQSTPANNTLTLPAGSDGDKISILDANYLFATYPVTITSSSTIDGFTGINMNIDHCWVDYVYSATDAEWKTMDALYGSSGGGGGSAPQIVDLDLSAVTNPTLQANRIYLVRPDETVPANNEVTLPAGSDSASIIVLDVDSKFDAHPVIVNGAVDGYTGINMNVKHCWLNFLYSMESSQYGTQDPYAGEGTSTFFTAPNGNVFQLSVDNNGLLSTQQL